METLIHQGIIVDSSVRSRKALMRDLEQSSAAEKLIEAHSVQHGLELLKNIHSDGCFIGPALSEKSAVAFVKESREVTKNRTCSIIAFVDETRYSPSVLLRAGADNVISRSDAKNHFTTVVQHAIREAKQNALVRTVEYQTEKAAHRTPGLLLADALEQKPITDILAQASEDLLQIASAFGKTPGLLLSDGLPTFEVREALKSAIEKCVLASDATRRLEGFDQHFVESVLGWFVERVHRSEQDATERLRQKLLGFHLHNG